MNQPYKQVLLVILDGWGYSEHHEFNAIYNAFPNCMNHLWETYPHSLLKASGEAIGLPEGQIGTSEIGHLTLGAGTVLLTDVVRINKAISDGSYATNPEFEKLFAHVKGNRSTLHTMGLLSPGGVHSHQEHLFAFIRAAKAAGIEKLAVHVFTDGRDVPPMSAQTYLEDLQKVIDEVGLGHISTMIGRYDAMDRDNNWERTQKAVDLMFAGIGKVSTESPLAVITKSHEAGVEDQYTDATLFPFPNGSQQLIQRNDGIFFYNFRPDRARQISQKILEKTSDMNLYFVTMTQYDKQLPTHVAFMPFEIKDTLAQEVARHNLTQAHIGETEKYAHVTYFFNGGNETPHKNEEFILVPSRKDVATYDLAPQMSAEGVADKTIEQIEKGTNFIVINFANADMVGHVGKYEPTIQAIKFEDTQIKRVVDAMQKNGGVVFITADHGNAEHMYNEEAHQPSTAHSLNPVPGILTDTTFKMKPTGTLADVAPTILQLFGIAKPQDMTGESLIA